MDYYSDWTERLIRCVEMRPALYDKNLKEYSDRYKNKEKWDEVCQEMINNWDQLSSQEKTIKAKEVQQRWRNLRTCFKRELNKQQKGDHSRRRKYIYFDLLTFLLPVMEDQETVSNNDSAIITKEELEDTDEFENFNDEDFMIEPPQRPVAKQVKGSNVSPFYEELSVKTFQKREVEETDEDKLFLLSLVPALKRLDEDQKLDAKMEILKVLKRVKNTSHLEDSQAFPDTNY